MARQFDIVVWGASGFTGKLICDYLSKVPELKWAAAGRSKTKIQEGLDKIGVSVPVIVADAGDEASLVEMAKQTKLVMAAAGPFLLYGSLVIKACAENGTHYVDITGESGWIASMVKKHNDSAVSTKALIVPSCGFDSIPSDLCTLLAITDLKAIAPPGSEVGDIIGEADVDLQLSGGSLTTGLTMRQASPEIRAASRDPYGCSPLAGKPVPPPTFSTSWTFNGVRSWGSLWMMTQVNGALVRRTWGLLETADSSLGLIKYGPQFSYNEVLRASGRISAIFSSIKLVANFLMMTFFPSFVARLGPKPGEGPPLEWMKKKTFAMTTTAKTVDQKYEAQVRMEGRGDPGYLATAWLFAESALTIVKDYDRLPAMAHKGGFLTPATALGTVLVENLEKTGKFSFEHIKSKSV